MRLCLLLSIIAFSFLSARHFDSIDKTWVQLWQFENNFYIEVDGHVYFIEHIKHSINCPCSN